MSLLIAGGESSLRQPGRFLRSSLWGRSWRLLRHVGVQYSRSKIWTGKSRYSCG